MKKSRAIFVVWLGQCLAGGSNGHRTRLTESTPEAVLKDFIPAFDNLEWEKFRGFFNDDAKVFYPRGFTHRAHGRTQFEANFRKVFEQIRGDRTEPPYMDLEPRDLEIQRYGDTPSPRFISTIGPVFSIAGPLCCTGFKGNGRLSTCTHRKPLLRRALKFS